MAAMVPTKPYPNPTVAIPADFVEAREEVHPGARSWRNTGGRVFRVGGAGERWWIGQVRPGGALRSSDHLGEYASHADAQAALDEFAKAMRMQPCAG